MMEDHIHVYEPVDKKNDTYTLQCNCKHTISSLFVFRYAPDSKPMCQNEHDFQYPLYPWGKPTGEFKGSHHYCWNCPALAFIPEQRLDSGGSLACRECAATKWICLEKWPKDPSFYAHRCGNCGAISRFHHSQEI